MSVYRGIPDELFGMPLSSLEKTTNIEVDKLQPGVANRIKEGMKVDSLEEADRLLQSYEDEIAKNESTKTANANAHSQNANTSGGTGGSSSSGANSSNTNASSGNAGNSSSGTTSEGGN